MLRWLGNVYARRVVNVNVNILLAGLLALAPTLGVVHLMQRLLQSGVVDASHLHLSDKAIITGTTLVADIVFDVTIYFVLHWIANHVWAKSDRLRKQLPRIEGIADAAVETVPFFKDATKVQFERMVLSPLLYALFLGTQFTLMTVSHTPPVVATIAGFVVGITCARTLHTLWMLRCERRAARAPGAGVVPCIDVSSPGDAHPASGGPAVRESAAPRGQSTAPAASTTPPGVPAQNRPGPVPVKH